MIIPSIDLQKGRAVQLRRGREKLLERDDPVALSEDFARFGEVAVIDLDAALDQGSNRDLIRRLCETADCRVGGGIRTPELAARIIEMGALRIIVGTSIFDRKGIDRVFLEELTAAVGRDRVTAALDVQGGGIAIRGWRETTGLIPEEVIPELEPFVSGFLFTCVDREGMMEGTDREAVRRIRAATTLPVTAAGGVATLEEVTDLSSLGVDLQLGMALYTGAFSTAEAFSAALDWSGGLIPTITRDRAGRILMLAYSSRESLARTFAEGRVWYFSRSRRELWNKGATSGNFQRFLTVRTDCDGDALLLTVDPAGPACHTGAASCFGDCAFAWDDLHAVVGERLRNPRPGSYTAGLTDERLREKLVEEADELGEARSRRDIIWEAADVLYHLTVKLARAGIGPAAVHRELRRRRLADRKDRRKR